MDKLVEDMRVALNSIFILYSKIHRLHWNILGPKRNRVQKFFDKLYKEIWQSIIRLEDHINLAEQLRELKKYPAERIENYPEISVIEREDVDINTIKMDNEKIIESLNIALDGAKKNGSEGLSKFLTKRIYVHTIYGSMLNRISQQ